MDIGDFNNYAEVIFRKKFMVSVPVLSTYSEYELDILGIPMNEIDGEKKNTFNEFVTVMNTIEEMCEKFNNGFPIRVLNQDDIMYIYDIIQGHLAAWKTYRYSSLNQSSIDISDDLILMDKFANEIFSNGKRTIVESNIVKTAAYGNNFTDLLMGRRKTLPAVIDYDEIERESMAPEKERTSRYDLESLLK